MRIALLVDPLTVRVKGGSHAPPLAEALGARSHEVRLYGAPSPLRDAVEASAPTLRGLHAFQPDWIVAYDELSPTAWRGAKQARQGAVRLLLVETGRDAADVPVGERALRVLGERLWGRGVRDAASGVLALDPVARARALAQGFDSERVRILPEGVDCEQFAPGSVSEEVARHRVRGRMLLYVGPLSSERGLELLVTAFARTVGQREDWALVLAGEGSAGPRLRAQAERLGVSARVHLVGRPQPEALPGWMGAATLLCMPALDDRPRCRQVQRAMACGLPVLASDLARPRFFVEPGATGLLAPAGDLEAWCEALTRVASSPEVRRRWGERARQVARERFAWTHIAERFERMLEGWSPAQERGEAS